MAGAHWVNNALAVIAAVDALGGDLAAAGLALADLKGLPGRGARRRISIGGESALLIDESYHDNPASMAAALRVLGETPATGRKIAVLGALRELGPARDQSQDRKSVGWGKGVSVGVDHRGSRIIKKKKNKRKQN